jgi:hypothetical protein
VLSLLPDSLLYLARTVYHKRLVKEIARKVPT